MSLWKPRQPLCVTADLYGAETAAVPTTVDFLAWYNRAGGGNVLSLDFLCDLKAMRGANDPFTQLQQQQTGGAQVDSLVAIHAT